MYDPKQNPLNNVRVNIIKSCSDRNHYANLLIWGGCTACRRVFGLGEQDGKVFERLATLKKLGV